MEGSILLFHPCQKDLDIKVTRDVYPVAEYQRSSLAPLLCQSSWWLPLLCHG